MSDVTRYLRPDLIATVQRLDLRAKLIMEGFYAGLHASPYHGFSVEFSEHRKYVLGDDLRSIDWQVFGRTDRLYVKKFEAETTLDAYLLVDTSASMGFPTPEQIEPGGAARMSKLDYAICLAATLGYMMVMQQDSVGLFALDEGVRFALPPRSKRAHLTNLIAELARIRPTGATNLANALHEAARRVKRRAMFILFSDLLTEPGPLIEAFHHVRFRGHDLIVFCVLDWAEANFPYRGATRFEAVEGGGGVTAEAQALRAAYLDALKVFLKRHADEAAAIGADFIQVDNRMTFDQALVPFLLRRKSKF